MKCYAVENHPNDSRVTIDPKGIVQTLSSRMGTGGNNTPFVLIASESENVMMNPVCVGNGQLVQAKIMDKVNCLDCMHDQKMILFTKQRHDTYIDGKVASALKERDYKEFTDLVQDDTNRKYVLRRLTPVECARLQGFPDWWCDGADGSDSAQYKLWGNGVALPCVCDLIGRVAEDIRNG